MPGVCRGLLDLEPMALVWTLNVQPNCYSIHVNVDLTSRSSTRIATHTAPARESVDARSGAAQSINGCPRVYSRSPPAPRRACVLCISFNLIASKT